MRSNTLDAARRAYMVLVRGIVSGVDDSKLMQSVDARLLHNELLSGIERFQAYGFSSVPMAATGKQAAEVIVGCINGHRSHPVVLAIDDRRYRPKNLEAGASCLYHYQGATLKLTTTGYQYDAGPQKQPHVTTVGASVLTASDAQITAKNGAAVFTVANGQITAQIGGVTCTLAGGRAVLSAGGPPVIVDSGMVYLGGDPNNGDTFAFVSTVSGPSNTVKAKI